MPSCLIVAPVKRRVDVWRVSRNEPPNGNDSPAGRLLNNAGVTLPQPSRRQFILDGGKWEMPTCENAEDFVKRLVSKDLLKRDEEIAAALQDEPGAFSTRTAQRRFLRVVQQLRTIAEPL